MKKIFSKDEIADIAAEVLSALRPGGHAAVLALSGDLGAGKTTLTQALAAALGVRESVVSPTFVIMKAYALPRAECARGFDRLVHIDAYRLAGGAELEKLGWRELLADPHNLIIVEWPERVADVMPEDALRLSLSHVSETDREAVFTA